MCAVMQHVVIVKNIVTLKRTSVTWKSLKQKAVRVQAKRRVSILKRKKTGACVVTRVRPATCFTSWKRNKVRVRTLLIMSRHKILMGMNIRLKI